LHVRRHRFLDVEVVEEPLVGGVDDGRPPEQLHDVRHGLVPLPAADGAFADPEGQRDVDLVHLRRHA